MKDVYTPEEAAEKLKVGKATIMRWLKDGKLGGVRLGHKTWRITEDDLEKFLESMRGQK